MGANRIGPLIALVVIGALALCLRLFQVQILEHEVWASEAAKLVRSGSIVPYRRGSIVDAQGRVLASDHPGYVVEFCYRDFRRSHPLGLIAHARSSLIGRAVSLAETLPNARQWARELALLSPAALDALGRGEGLETSGGLRVAPSLDRDLDQCAARRADVRFYALALLELDARERRALRKAASDDQPIESFAAFVAVAREQTIEHVLERLEMRVVDAASDLVAFAQLLASDARAASDGADPFASLLEELERARVSVEDESAAELFRRTTGFGAGRVAPELLTEHVDLDWLAGILRWSEPRLREWLERARADWLDARDRWHVDGLLAELRLAPSGPSRAQALIGELALLFAPAAFVERARRAAHEDQRPIAWWELDRLLVLDEVETLFAADVDSELALAPVLPFQHDELRGERDVDPWRTLARLDLVSHGEAAPTDARVAELAAQWRERAEERVDQAWVRERVVALLARWDEPLQRAIARCFAAARGGADEDERTVGGKLALAEARVALCAEQAPYVIKDRGNRPFLIDGDPPYELVWTVSRYRERLAGFAVRVEQSRELEASADEAPVARALIGRVGEPDMLALRRVQREARELATLRALGTRSEAEEARLRELVVRVDRPGERRGTEGLEGYFDAELRGSNGYREIRGLAEIEDDRSLELDFAARDGGDVILCLDRALQRAAEDVLAHPAGDPDPSFRDQAWLDRPVGALVLITVEGDVLAAASVPQENRESSGGADLRDLALERTLRLYEHQPPGSVLKPFVAAFALDRIALDPRARVECAARESGRANYKGLHCSSSRGHGVVDLATALKVSCNCYFAWLGEQFDAKQAIDALSTFGFGEPTGVRPFGSRAGLREDWWRDLAKLTFRNAREPLMFGNGLAVVQSTPMQVARAFAGLATGRLPTLRLASRVGARTIEPHHREIELERSSLDFVRAAMTTVTSEPGGSAHAALSPSALGFVMAAKTGSADYKRLSPEDSADGENLVRKHTWLAGWFPADAPRYVLVVFEFDTLRTASHSAVWVARQFLERPETREFLQREAEHE